MLALLAFAMPTLIRSATPAAASPAGLTIVICTTEGFATVTVADEVHAPAKPAQGHDHTRADCPACLGRFAMLPPPGAQAAAPAPPARIIISVLPLEHGTAARAPPHTRPAPTGPPSLI